MKGIFMTIFLALVLSLMGCSKLYFGYNQEEWNKLSKLQQQQVMANYRKAREEQAKLIYGDPAKDAGDAFVERATGYY
ncbi:MAG: hypothetical protein MI867_04815 [Pseudomonadales bacterium]|nr:hypothetical protein [Pseudomonadales bacterium]